MHTIIQMQEINRKDIRLFTTVVSSFTSNVLAEKHLGPKNLGLFGREIKTVLLF